MQRTAWAVALLMNSTGNYKKNITADSLYKSLDARREEQEKIKRNNMSREELEKELLQAFKL